MVNDIGILVKENMGLFLCNKLLNVQGMILLEYMEMDLELKYFY